jgi:hypothetical protein
MFTSRHRYAAGAAFAIAAIAAIAGAGMIVRRLQWREPD